MKNLDITGLVGSLGSLGFCYINLTEVLQQASAVISLLGSAGALWLTCISIAKQIDKKGNVNNEK